MLFFVALEKFWHKWRRHHCRQRAADLLLDLFLSLMAIEHWGFLSVPHILLYGTYVCKVISEDLWRSRMLPTVICGTDITFLTAYICRLWNSNLPAFGMPGECSDRLCHRRDIQWNTASFLWSIRGLFHVCQIALCKKKCIT